MAKDAAQRVLVIDDDASIGQEICDSLALRNFDGTYAENINQARQHLAGEDGLGIVIVDYHMPGITGPEVIETLKRETARHLVFIVLTGDDTQAAAIKAVKAQAFDFLRKPVDGAVVIDAVRRAADHLAQLIETDRHNDEAKAEARALKERLDSVSQLLRHREDLLETLLSVDPSQVNADLAAHRDDDSEHGTEAAPLECAPVDISAVIHRMLPALQQLSSDRNIQLKTRVSGQLPFLYGDQKRLARAITDVAVVLISGLSHGDGLTIMAVKDSADLLVSFRIKSGAPDDKYERAFGAELNQAIDRLDDVEVSEMKLLGARIVVHLHGGRSAIDTNSGTEWYLRIFFPLPGTHTAH